MSDPNRARCAAAGTLSGRADVRRTSPLDLLAAFVLLAVAAYALLRIAYADLPSVEWFMAVPVALLAAAEVVAAGRVRAAVRHKPGAKPVTALAIARCVALAKASVLGGAALGGVMAALVVRVAPDAANVDAARHDLVSALLVLVSSAALIVGGWLLEGAAIDPSRRA